MKMFLTQIALSKHENYQKKILGGMPPDLPRGPATRIAPPTENFVYTHACMQATPS